MKEIKYIFSKLVSKIKIVLSKRKNKNKRTKRYIY